LHNGEMRSMFGLKNSQHVWSNAQIDQNVPYKKEPYKPNRIFV